MTGLEPLYTAAEMRAAEERYPGHPESMSELMERAGRAVARIALEDFEGARSYTVVCGRGNNGGDKEKERCASAEYAARSGLRHARIAKLTIPVTILTPQYLVLYSSGGR